MRVQPLASWRQVTKLDFAAQMKDLAGVCFADAKGIRVVLDNLNTHKLCLYDS